MTGIADDNFGNVNEHLLQRHHYEVNNVPNVRPAVARALHQLGQGIRCIEVGVAYGANAKAILDALQPSVMVLVDIWENIIIDHDTYSDKAYIDCKDLLSNYHQCQYMQGKSQEILPTLPANSFDFAYIDAAHDSESVANDVHNCIRLVRVGGIVGGDDYAIQAPLQSVALGVYLALHGLESVKQDGYDWWVTVTPKMKELDRYV